MPAPAVTQAPLEFHPVSEHEDSEIHRPARHRHAVAPVSAPDSLQLVETSAAVIAAPIEDELPRRTKPRRRRAMAEDTGPLQLVETQPGTEAPPAENPPAS